MFLIRHMAMGIYNAQDSLNMLVNECTSSAPVFFFDTATGGYLHMISPTLIIMPLQADSVNV